MPRGPREIGGIIGSPTARSSAWSTTFEVADADAVVARACEAGGTADDVEYMIYGHTANVTDPFGAEFSVIARAPGM